MNDQGGPDSSGCAEDSGSMSKNPDKSGSNDSDLPPEDILEQVLRRFDTHSPEPNARRAKGSEGESGSERRLESERAVVEEPEEGALLDRLASEGPTGARYRALGMIGRGGMGEVLEIWDPHLRRSLAMKVALGVEPTRRGEGQPTPEDSRLARFLEEAQVTAQLDHPGVVPVHELGIDAEGHVYFTMAHVGGEDLSVVYRRARAGEPGWSQARVIGLLQRICETVAYAHAKGVIHRDLKPANVRVGEFGEVYVLDWGIAKLLGRPAASQSEPATATTMVASDRRKETDLDPLSPLLTKEGTAAGTPGYMSPEQARGEVDALDARTDVYAVGAMLYEFLAGCTPFGDRERRGGALELVLAVLREPPTPLSVLAPESPAELVAICEKAMAREPGDRYGSLREMGEELRAWLEGRVVSAYETGAFAELKKWVGRNRIVAGISLALLLTLIGGVAVSSTFYVIADSETRKLRRSMVSVHRTRLDRLLVDEATLWPPRSEMVTRLSGWVSEAESLLRDVADLHSQLASSDAESGALARVEALEEDLEILTDPETGLLDGRSRRHGIGVRARLAWAATVEERTTQGDHARALWREALSSIADPAECPAYRGLRLTPQAGLLPVGKDPASGLWEFAAVGTGEVPERSKDDRLLAIDERSAIVFVLLPPGPATIGSQTSDPQGAYYDQNVDEVRAKAESPLQTVELEAFFLAKYELTQGQWLRLTGERPSRYAPGGTSPGPPIDLCHPVEQISWEAGVEVLGWIGLTLPTEAQWEYAARAGTTWPWWTGPERESMRGKINLADQSAGKVGEDWSAIEDWLDLDDGWPYHGRVGSFPANAFGLHEVLGNVFELCRDEFHLSPLRVKSFGPDGERLGGGVDERVVRGGAFNCPAWRCSVSNRFGVDAKRLDNNVGLRAARRVDS